MNHLKKFSESSEYWTTITSEYFNGCDIVNFHKDEIRKMENLCDENHIDMEINRYFYNSSRVDFEKEVSYQILPIRSTLYKIEDDYYILAYNTGGRVECYKADQLDGLIKLLKHIY